MASEAKLLTVQFLQWLAVRPRLHAEVRNAWSSTCPLNCAFEDAICDDLVERGAGGHLVLSERGRARLAGAAADRSACLTRPAEYRTAPPPFDKQRPPLEENTRERHRP
jgi:hypothetical protein